jgi:agmatine/peptidylarginine deiminase
MTNEEIINEIRCLLSELDNGEDAVSYLTQNDIKWLNKNIKALEQDTKTEQFAKWVATEIFDDMWEYNKDAFAEIACRKLAKLGIVRAKGDEWELVEPQESEE